MVKFIISPRFYKLMRSRWSVGYVRAYSTIPTVSDSLKSEIKKLDGDMLETIEIENLPRALRRYAKQVDELNLIRIKEIFAKNFKNIRALVALLILAISIYFYTILAVKQETFLEEIDQEVAEEMDTKTSKK